MEYFRENDEDSLNKVGILKQSTGYFVILAPDNCHSDLLFDMAWLL